MITRSETLDATTFWLVWNPTGKNPSYRHPSEASAITEAERLARENPGNTFVVLQTVCARRVDYMLRVDMRPGAENEEIPF